MTKEEFFYLMFWGVQQDIVLDKMYKDPYFAMVFHIAWEQHNKVIELERKLDAEA